LNIKQKITIAIDGFSSSGKSTLAKDLSEELGYTYLDSGAMYRAVTLYCLENRIDISNISQVKQALQSITLYIPPANDKTFAIHLNDRDVTDLIRSMEVSNSVSEVAAISEVRTFLVALQQQAGASGGIVMDGRDIGTVVFPKAELKLYVDSPLSIRAKRRYNELVRKGLDVTLDDVTHNLMHRDHIDSNRADSPLKKAKDAFIIDNTNLNRSDQLKLAVKLTQEKLDELSK